LKTLRRSRHLNPAPKSLSLSLALCSLTPIPLGFFGRSQGHSLLRGWLYGPMAFPFKHSKRLFERNSLEPNGKGKWQKSSHLSVQQSKLKLSPGSTVFRILCPATKSGSVIGKGGGIITKIRKETGAKIRIEEIIPGCEERVVVITGPDKETEDRNGQRKEEDPYMVDDNEDDDAKASDDGEDVPKGKDHPGQEGSQSDKATSAAQKALLLVFERIAEGDSETDSIDEENKKSSCVARLLVLSSQVGSLLGKGGSVIKQMASGSGAQIRVLARDKLPACASPVDEIVQITGAIDSVRKALQSISQQLLENPPRERDLLLPEKVPGPSSHPFASLPQLGISRNDVLPPSSFHHPDQGLPFSSRPHEMLDFHPRIPPSMSKFPEIGGPIKVPVSPEPLTFRLICTSDKVGSVIGKGGSIVKIIQSETSCEIKIIETVPDSDDRIVVITGPAVLFEPEVVYINLKWPAFVYGGAPIADSGNIWQEFNCSAKVSMIYAGLPSSHVLVSGCSLHPDDRVSPVQDAILRVQNRVVMASPDSKESTVSARVMVSSSQTGCLLGKGGSIVAEMRKLSGAQIRILSKDQVPEYASENEVLVQVTGKFEAVQEALLQITSRLKHHIFSEKFPAMGHPGHTAFVDQGPQFPSFMGRRERSPHGLYSNALPPFSKFDPLGVHPHDERSGFPRTHYTSGFSTHSGERIPSGPWQGIGGGDGPIGIDDTPGASRRLGGFAGGSQPPLIRNATIDVVVPRAVVPVIRGEDGGCLKQICQISGANINITDPRPGATETVILISGSPDQTHAAQSLIQAFVLSESGSS
ncbi:hypothetical protein Taro_040701, partial [Colocasia esculenta]|nr:hypothetical protein [Colocasia esculenta]